MSTPRAASRLQMAVVFGLLLLCQFYLRPRLLDTRFAPDFLMIGLVLFALRNGPGAGAAAGFLVGLASDALVPARFGAAALAHTLIGYLAAWSRAIFFADNLLVSAAFLFGATWCRDLILLLASGSDQSGLLTGLLLDAPVRAAATAVAGTLVHVAFREWFAIRLDL